MLADVHELQPADAAVGVEACGGRPQHRSRQSQRRHKALGDVIEAEQRVDPRAIPQIHQLSLGGQRVLDALPGGDVIADEVGEHQQMARPFKHVSLAIQPHRR